MEHLTKGRARIALDEAKGTRSPGGGRRRQRPGIIAAVALAAALTGAGISLGYAQDAAVIDGCYDPKDGALRVIDAGAGQSCDPKENPISWNAEGPQGPEGPQGEPGAAGPAGPPGPAAPIERPLPVSWSGNSTYIILDVENGPDVFTTVRLFNNSGSDQAYQMHLLSSDGTPLASCENPRVKNGVTVDWCITPSHFGVAKVATLGIVVFGGGSHPFVTAISAFVTKSMR